MAISDAEAGMIADCEIDIAELTTAVVAVIEEMRCGRNVAANAEILTKLQERRAVIRVAVHEWKKAMA